MLPNILAIKIIEYKIKFEIEYPSLKAKKLNINNMNIHINPSFNPSSQPLLILFFPNKNPPIKNAINGIIYENIFTKPKPNIPI